MMSLVAILEFRQGSFDEGFSVTLRFGEEGKNLSNKLSGRLPSAPSIPELYENWLSIYRQSAINQRKLEKPQSQLTNFSYSESCEEAAQNLIDKLNDWLIEKDFIFLQNQLLKYLKPSDSLRILIETDNNILQHLPWNKWNFLNNYPNAEIALGHPDYQNYELEPHSRKQVKILAILGDSTNINIDTDRKLLECLPDADVTFLPEPRREEISDCLWEQGWDILFFAGHSQTDEVDKGRIYINASDSLPVADKLRNALQTAIRRGLKIAIFNSCDGLGLARDLASLNIPQTIIMREPVPDKVAQEFLKHFLARYSQGQTLYQAVREARERLEVLEDEYPCATWLPIIYQNQAYTPLTWAELTGGNNQKQVLPEPVLYSTDVSTPPNQNKLLSVFVSSIVATALVLLGRSVGILEKFELSAFNLLMLMRPSETEDPRIVVVEATDEDINKYGFPLPDNILADAIDKLEQHQAKVIGLDILRPDNREAKLAKQFESNNRLLAICRFPDNTVKNNTGIAKPSTLPNERSGFSDIIVDRDKNNTNATDEVVRRHLLFLTPGREQSNCVTSSAFNVLLASDYLGEKYQWDKDKEFENVLRLGDVKFKLLPLEGSIGGYHKLDGRGSQILLNYRANPNIAKTVTLSALLNNQVKPDVIKNKIVLIGVTDSESRDYHMTPYGKMAGVFIHAHSVSQIISAVEDKRPLLNIWSQPVEILWIWSWAFIAGTVALVLRARPHYYFVLIPVATVALTGICLLILIKGIWVPLVPSLLVVFVTSSLIIFYLNKSWKYSV